MRNQIEATVKEARSRGSSWVVLTFKENGFDGVKRMVSEHKRKSIRIPGRYRGTIQSVLANNKWTKRGRTFSICVTGRLDIADFSLMISRYLENVDVDDAKIATMAPSRRATA